MIVFPIPATSHYRVLQAGRERLLLSSRLYCCPRKGDDSGSATITCARKAHNAERKNRHDGDVAIAAMAVRSPSARDARLHARLSRAKEQESSTGLTITYWLAAIYGVYS
jgi:hypothetical protein